MFCEAWPLVVVGVDVDSVGAVVAAPSAWAVSEPLGRTDGAPFVIVLDFSNSNCPSAAANATATLDTKVIALTADGKRAGGSGDRSGLGGAVFADYVTKQRIRGKSYRDRDDERVVLGQINAPKFLLQSRTTWQETIMLIEVALGIYVENRLLELLLHARARSGP